MARLIIASFCVALSACAAAPPGPEFFDSAERAIAAAERAGAEELSPVELRFARERLQLARTAVENRKYEPAMYAIEQSEINSELAIEQSRTALQRRRVNELRESNEALHAELVGLYGEEFDE